MTERILFVGTNSSLTNNLFTALQAAVRTTRPAALRDAYLLRTLVCRVHVSLPAVTRINLVVGDFLEASKVWLGFCRAQWQRAEDDTELCIAGLGGLESGAALHFLAGDRLLGLGAANTLSRLTAVRMALRESIDDDREHAVSAPDAPVARCHARVRCAAAPSHLTLGGGF